VHAILDEVSPPPLAPLDANGEVRARCARQRVREVRESFGDVQDVARGERDGSARRHPQHVAVRVRRARSGGTSGGGVVEVVQLRSLPERDQRRPAEVGVDARHADLPPLLPLELQHDDVVRVGVGSEHVRARRGDVEMHRNARQELPLEI
tara:strand:+ start:2347 stop:2799 length:453 start_codon:yes stop_codon:yes gene_type:complete